MQLGLFLYADINYVFYKCQSFDENDEGLLLGRLVALRPDKYVGVDLTLIGNIKTFVMCTSRMRNKAYWGWYKYIRNNASDEAVGFEAEVEIDIRG